MPRMPLIEVKGNYYDIGFQIGSMLKKQIKKTIKIPEKVAKDHQFFKINYFIKIAQKYFPYANKYFPQYVTELKGIADGSNQDFDLIWLLNAEEVLVDMYFDKCTSVVLKEEDNIYLYHNEDFEISFMDNIAIVKADINNKVKFLSLTFAGMLPGSSVSLNSFGLVQGINTLHPTDSKIGVPKNFISRAIIEADSIRSAFKIIKNKERASAYNHTLIQDNKAFSIETTANDYKILKIKENFFLHTNHYLTRLSKKGELPVRSVVKYNHAMEMLKKANVLDKSVVMSVLSSHLNDYPICRHKSKLDSEVTLASFIVDCNNLKMYVANGNPCKAKHEEYSL